MNKVEFLLKNGWAQGKNGGFIHPGSEELGLEPNHEFTLEEAYERENFFSQFYQG